MYLLTHNSSSPSAVAHKVTSSGDSGGLFGGDGEGGGEDEGTGLFSEPSPAPKKKVRVHVTVVVVPRPLYDMYIHVHST